MRKTTGRRLIDSAPHIGSVVDASAKIEQHLYDLNVVLLRRARQGGVIIHLRSEGGGGIELLDLSRSWTPLTVLRNGGGEHVLLKPHPRPRAAVWVGAGLEEYPRAAMAPPSRSEHQTCVATLGRTQKTIVFVTARPGVPGAFPVNRCGDCGSIYDRNCHQRTKSVASMSAPARRSAWTHPGCPRDAAMWSGVLSSKSRASTVALKRSSFLKLGNAPAAAAR